MIDTNAAMQNNLPADFNDEQLDMFFEKGGKEEVLNTTPEPTTETTPDEQVKAEETSLPIAEEKKAEPLPVSDEQERSYKAMAHEERERRKELQRQFQDQQLRIQKMEDEYKKVNEDKAKSQIPSFEEDPLTHLKIENERLKQFAEQQVERDKQMHSYNEQMRKQQEFMSRYQNDAMAYATNTKDFQDAYAHLSLSRFNEYVAAGYDPATAQKLLVEDELLVVGKAYQDEVNPAERLYALAKIRGYQSKEQSVSTEVLSKNKTNTQKIEHIEKVVNAKNPLSDSSGKVDKGSSIESLLEMDDEEFDKNWGKLIK